MNQVNDVSNIWHKKAVLMYIGFNKVSTGHFRGVNKTTTIKTPLKVDLLIKWNTLQYSFNAPQDFDMKNIVTI